MANIANIAPLFAPIAESVVRNVPTIFAKVAELATIAQVAKDTSVIAAFCVATAPLFVWVAAVVKTAP